ncbi:MAG: iron ABC transporter permease [Gammaproteobacteria bacterium]|nr:iron ABC transporter permease [Gammaproteobacteria bacterium]
MLALCALALLLAVSLGISLGSAGWYWPLSFADASSPAFIKIDVIGELRMARVIAGAVVGALLALAGVLLQIVLRNPLAEPFVLGVSGGASASVLLVITFGWTFLPLPLAAWLGALLSLICLIGLSARHSASPERILLMGVVLATGWGAVLSFLLSLGAQQQLQVALFWLLGDLSVAQHWPIALAILIVVFIWAHSIAPILDILIHGNTLAYHAGINVQRVQLMVLIMASLACAAAVACAGPIGFIGLIVPHVLRLSGVRRHRYLLSASILLGAALLVFADTLARVWLAPQQLPVGVCTALIGVPLFIYLLRRRAAALDAL